MMALLLLFRFQFEHHLLLYSSVAYEIQSLNCLIENYAGNTTLPSAHYVIKMYHS